MNSGMLGQLGSILTDVVLGSDLLGGSGGDLLGGESEAQPLPEEVQQLQNLVVVNPDQDLNLTLESDLQIR